MAIQFFSELSQNFINILEDDEYYDVTIEVGQDPEVKIFRAHMVILNYRSNYFRKNLSRDNKESDGIFTHVKLSEITPNTFQIILNNTVENILPTRNLHIDSRLITSKVAAYIASWIDRKETKHPIYGYTPYNTLDNPYEFKLLLRGSEDGLGWETFHDLCDYKSNTVVIAKVKGTNEILGGYNPLIWESRTNKSYSHTSDSFIFSFTFMNLKDVVLSRINKPDSAVLLYEKYGPSFGDDLTILFRGTVCYSKKDDYEKSIRSETDCFEFELEDYEVYEVLQIDYNEADEYDTY
ncbi:2920_t:CDS:2 [Funneliformis geosporum]|nr:2920_t:CDS:2 [Funneliformis geosporum]